MVSSRSVVISKTNTPLGELPKYVQPIFTRQLESGEVVSITYFWQSLEDREEEG